MISKLFSSRKLTFDWISKKFVLGRNPVSNQGEGLCFGHHQYFIVKSENIIIVGTIFVATQANIKKKIFSYPLIN